MENPRPRDPNLRYIQWVMSYESQEKFLFQAHSRLVVIKSICCFLIKLRHYGKTPTHSENNLDPTVLYGRLLIIYQNDIDFRSIVNELNLTFLHSYNYFGIKSFLIQYLNFSLQAAYSVLFLQFIVEHLLYWFQDI